MTTAGNGRGGMMGFLRTAQGWPYLLTPFIPIAVALEIAGAAAGLVFVTAALGIIPTAALMGLATEELAARSGPGIGGLLNVTFGNAPELIIALFALGEGLHEVVKASIVGSIIGNVLLVLGASMFVGGLGREKQEFRAQAATAQASMLFLAGAALVMPAIFELVEGQGLPSPGAEIVDYGATVEHLSVAVAVVLIATYGAGLIFSLRTHRDMFNPPYEEEETYGWSVRPLGRDARDRRRRRRRDVGDPRRLDLGGLGGGRAVGVLHRRDRGRDRRQRRRALGRRARRAQGQDGPRGQHRDRLQRPDRALRRPGARARLVRDRARRRCRSSSTASSSARSCSRS